MNFRQTSGGSEDSENYVRLKDGESVMGVFLGDLCELSTHWENNRSTLCSEDLKRGSCGICRSTGVRGSFRFRLNLITKNPDGSYSPKIFEQGWKVYKQLRQLNDEYPLETTIVKITRSGSTRTDTSYTILPIKNSNVPPELAKKLAQIKLIDLRPSEEKKPEGSVPDETCDAHEEPAFVTDDISF